MAICPNISGIGLYYNGDNPTAAECAFILIAVALAAGDAIVLGCTDVSMVYESRGQNVSWLQWLGVLDTTVLFKDDVRLSDR
jgi:hypothetical protein